MIKYFKIILLLVPVSIFSQAKLVKGFTIDENVNAVYAENYYENYYEESSVSLNQSLNNLIEGMFEKYIDNILIDKMDSILGYISNNSKNFNDLTRMVQSKLDTLIKNDSINCNQLKNIKDDLNLLTDDVSVLQEYTTIKKISNEYIIDLNPIRKKNKEIILGSDFHEGYAKIYNGNNTWGFINTNKELVIEYQYEEAGYFSCGLAPVKKNGEWKYINKDNKIVHERKDAIIAFPCYENKALIQYEDNKYKIIDLKPFFPDDDKILSDMALVWSNSKYHLFKTTGYRENGLFLLMDYNGETLLSKKYYISPVSENIVVIQNKRNEPIIVYDVVLKKSLIKNLPYKTATPFINGLSIVTNFNGESSIIDKNNDGKIPFYKQKITRITDSKFEIKYGVFKKVVYKKLKNDKVICIEGNCEKYDPDLIRVN